MKRNVWMLAALAVACASSSAPTLAPPAAVAGTGWRSHMPSPGEARPIEYPAPVVVRLENGLEVWSVKRPAHVVQITLAVKVGQSSVPKGKSGLAALTARMLTESTKDKSALELAEAAESLGTTLDDDAGRDYSLVSLRVLSSDLDPALDLLQEVVRRPRFAPEELERVRAEWLDSLVAERQSPQRLASLAALRLLLGEPHGAPVAGGITDVKGLSRDDIVSFHQSAWAPSAAALVVVGDVTPEQVQKAAERALGEWRAPSSTSSPSSTVAPRPSEPRNQPRVVVIDRPGSVQSALFAAQRYPARGASGFEARQILNGVVGGLFTSRLNQNLREKHAYTYGARSQAIATRSWGAFVVSTSVETNVTAPALSEILSELRQAKDPALGRPLDDQEIARSKADLQSSIGAHLESVDRVADDMVTLFSMSLKQDYWSRYGSLVASVTRAQIEQQARAHLAPDQLVVVIVGDAGAIDPALAKLPVRLERASPELVD